MKICFLVKAATSQAQAENCTYLTQAASHLGHEVCWADIDALHAVQGMVHAQVTSCGNEPLQWQMASLETFDLVWVLSFGRRGNFLDKIQLLHLLAERTRVVNHPLVLLFYHSKLSHHALAHRMNYPESYIDHNAERLWQIMHEKGGDWIIKPTGDSLGRGVFKLTPGDANRRVLLENLTKDGNYCLLQRYIPEVAKGEKRVLMAGGEVMGFYAKQGSDHRGNLHQGAVAQCCDLSEKERETCERIGRYLLEKGAYFVGIDLAWPYVLEWNVLSPGGLGTLERLGAGNQAEAVVKKVLSAPSHSLAKDL
ncbi:MAG: hypothetical protein SFT92_03505 [Rickettsiales bacterium]|nr:hypothetical protein [Rickettsiales bacterium]